MKNPWQKTISVLVSLSTLFPTLTYSATFNPNYIISDEEMQNWESMNRADIGAFLKEKDGYIANLLISDKDGNMRPVSDIIYRAAKEYRINPKYLLVKLQKEQSLVTDEDPTQKQLDWATGYGVCDSCSLDDPKIQKYKGFGKQVDAAADIIRWYYDNVTSQGWIKRNNQTYSIDNQQITPVNLATAFLYTYTPHLQGNENFWKLWQRWFEQVFPDGSLLRSPSDPTIYLIQDQKRRPIKSMSALVTRFDPKLVLTVPDSEISRYELGREISYPNYSILKNGSDYYLLDDDTLRPFESETVVKKIGYNPDEYVEVSANDIASFPRGSVITIEDQKPQGQLIRVKENNQLYFLKDGVYHIVTDKGIAQTQFPSLKEEKQSVKYLEKYESGDPILFKDGTLVQAKGFNKVYVIEKGKKRHIAGEEIFLGLGWQWKNIRLTDESTLSLHPTGQPVYQKIDDQPTNTLPATTKAVAITPVVAPSAPSTPSEIKNEQPTSPSANSKMVTVPDSETKYIGEKIESPVNTFLIASADTKEIKAGKNIDAVRPLASFTKVLTAYQLFSDSIDLNKVTFYKASEHKSTYGTFRVAEGEGILNSDILDAMLLSSINTAARMIVDSTESNESQFVAQMNTQLKNWGLNQSKVFDVSGEDARNVTTAREYLTLFTESLKQTNLLAELGKKSYQYTETFDLDGKPNHFDSHSNELMKHTDLPYTIIASKTGYLDEAGAGLAMLIERPTDKKRFVVITMGNPDYNGRFTEPDRLARIAIEKF